MKRLGVFLAVAVFGALANSTAHGQTAGDYRSAATGNWATLATWARYNGTTWVTPTSGQGTPTSTNGVITILSPHTVAVATPSITVDQTIVNAGGQITVNSTRNLVILDGTGTDLDVSGVLQNSGTVTTSTGLQNFASGAIYKHNRDGGTIPAAAWNVTSTCEVNGQVGATPPSGLGQTFGNFTWNSPGQTADVNLAGNFDRVNGNLTITSTGTGSTRLLNSGGLNTTTVGGNFSQSAGSFKILGGNGGAVGYSIMTVTGSFTLSGGTLDMNGSTNTGSYGILNVAGDFTISGTGLLTETGSNIGLVTFNGGGTTNYNNGGSTTNITNAISFLVTSNTILQMGTNLIVGDGTFNVGSGETLGISSAAGITTSGATGSIQVTGTRTYSAGANYIYNGSVNQNAGNGLTQNTPNNLTIANTGSAGNNIVTLDAALTITGDVNLNSGSLDVSASNFPILLGDNWTNNGGTFVPRAGSVTFNGALAQTIDGTATSQAFNNVVMNKPALDDLTFGGSTVSWTVNDLTLTQGDFIPPATLNINGNLIQTAGTWITDVNTNVKGNWTRSGGTFAAGGIEVVTFNGSTPQIVADSTATAFVNVTINSGATVQLNSGVAWTVDTTLTVNGTLVLPDTVTVVGTTAILALGAGGLIQTADADGVTGSATASFNTGFTTTSLNTNGTVEYNRSGNQTITGRTYRNLTSSGSGSKTLGGATTVAGVLTLNVDLTTGANILTQTGTSAGAGDVVGTVSRSDVGTTTRAFGNPLVRITNANIIIGAFTVNLLKGSTPTHLATGVRRQYTITSGAGSVNATMRLHYLGSELNSNTEATLELYRSDNGGLSFGSQGATTRGTAVDTDRWVEKTGITGFSPWGIAGPSAPTAIEMVGYSARAGRDGKVLLQWETGREVNNLGFNIYREEDGKRVQINKSLIVGSGLMASPGTVMTAGRSYAWQTSVDQAKESWFWIEEIDLSGYTVWHGPVVSQPSDAKMSARELAIADQTVTLSDMAAETYNGVTRPVESLAKAAKAQSMKLTAGLVSTQRPIARITLKQEGWYRIGQPQLVAAGLNPSVDPNSLQLFADGQEIPISVISNNGVFDSTSAIEFYGQGIDTPSTDTHIYSLVVGSAGLRIQNEEGQGGLPPSNSFLYSAERKDRLYYLTGVHNGDAENFFGTPVGAASVNQSITLKNVDATASGEATIEVAMQGFTSVPHLVTVSLNGNPLGTIQHNNQAQGVAQFQVPNSLLSEGQNLVTLASQAAGLDLSLVDHIRVTYWHSYAADGNALKFTAAANQEVTLTGFTSDDVKILDVTDPLAPSQIDAKVTSLETSPPTFVVTVSVHGTGTRTLLAIGGDQTRSPVRVAADKSSTWRSAGNAADMVIITHESLMNSYAQLKALRQSQGLKVALVDVEDLYDEFNSGNKSPQAIKDFLAYARSSWKTAPRFVLLAGSASYDPKNYNGLGEFDLVPTKLIDTVATETASDDWFADFNMDGIAEMAVGRLPTPTSEEAQTTVMKLAVYDNSPSLNSALLVADGNLNFDFEAANKALAASFPGSITVQQIARGQIGTAAAKQQLLSGIAAGQKIVNYAGHGSPSIWRDNLLTAADALALTNTGRYPLFVAMSCLNGEFQHPQLNPLATALMNSREGGAIAVWASSGMTAPAEQATMNQQFYSLLFQQPGLRLGEITNNAKSVVGDADVRRTWILFGDPSMRLK